MIYNEPEVKRLLTEAITVADEREAALQQDRLAKALWESVVETKPMMCTIVEWNAWARREAEASAAKDATNTAFYAAESKVADIAGKLFALNVPGNVWLASGSTYVRISRTGNHYAIEVKAVS